MVPSSSPSRANALLGYAHASSEVAVTVEHSDVGLHVGSEKSLS